MRAKLGLVIATLILFSCAMESTAYAQRYGHGGQSRHGSHGAFHRGGSRIIVTPSFGFGWGSRYYWGDPWYYNRFGYGYGYPGVVEVINYGTVKFKVEPESTRVYIDQKYVGTVDDLHDEKAYLSGGQHEIRLVAPNGQTLEQSVFVAVGKKLTIERYFGYGAPR